MREGVTITGRLEIDRFLLYMRACDVAVNLRHPTAGETSGTVIRLLGLGKPLIVNETGSFAEIPDDAAPRCRSTIRRRICWWPISARSPRTSRCAAAWARTPAGTWRSITPSPLRRGNTRTSCGIRSRPEPAPFRAVPPLTAYPEDDLLSDLVREASAEMVDLGVEEAEDDLLREIAAAIVEVNLDG